MGPACVIEEASKSATGIAGRCPLPQEVRAAEPIVKDLDEGTYAYALALHAALSSSGAAAAVRRRLVADILLSVSLERHARRPR
jgi:hypothetical protein